MTSGQWRRPATSAPGGAPASTDADLVLSSLAQALGVRPGELEIERQRLAGRSNIHVVRLREAGPGEPRWVVKQPHTAWSQDDIGSPLSADAEFAALQRLHDHFERLQLPYRVPSPVACFPQLGAFAMEFVDGTTLKTLLRYRSAVHPRPLLDGIAAAGTFLRHLHAVETSGEVDVDLSDEALKVLEVAEEKLHPLGLALPEEVRATMAALASATVSSRQVRLHGDFGPANIILAVDGSTVGLDADLSRVGAPEEDLARFVALVAGVIRLSPEVAVPPLAAVRRRLECQLLRSYYEQDTWPPLFELTYLHQLTRRWCRLRELAQQHVRRSVLPVKLKVIDLQVRVLMVDSARRLVTSLEVA